MRGLEDLAGDVPGLDGHLRCEWDALDAWFEEDEQVFVHPRNPYVRVDALRSSRPVRVELDGRRAGRGVGVGDGVRDRACRPGTTSTAPTVDSTHLRADATP